MSGAGGWFGERPGRLNRYFQDLFLALSLRDDCQVEGYAFGTPPRGWGVLGADGGWAARPPGAPVAPRSARRRGRARPPLRAVRAGRAASPGGCRALPGSLGRRERGCRAGRSRRCAQARHRAPALPRCRRSRRAVRPLPRHPVPRLRLPGRPGARHPARRGPGAVHPGSGATRCRDRGLRTTSRAPHGDRRAPRGLGRRRAWPAGCRPRDRRSGIRGGAAAGPRARASSGSRRRCGSRAA